MGLDGVAVQQHLAAASERHAGRCADNGERGVTHFLEGILTAFQQPANSRPQPQLGPIEQQRDVGADGKIAALVVDDQSFEPAAGQLPDRFLDHPQNERVEGIHLRGEFQAGHAIADIPQAGRHVAGDRRRGAFDVFQQ